jgi:hypothetical protein
MSSWVEFNKDWLFISAGIVLFIILSKIVNLKLFKVSSMLSLETHVRFRTVYILVFISFILGWAIANNITFFQSPEYQLFDYRSASAFDNIIESVSLDEVDNSNKSNSGSYATFYTADEPFLIEVQGFRGLLFCPARPEKLGKAGIIPIDQLALNSPPFRAHGILSTKIDIIIGNKKQSEKND